MGIGENGIDQKITGQDIASFLPHILPFPPFVPHYALWQNGRLDFELQGKAKANIVARVVDVAATPRHMRVGRTVVPTAATHHISTAS